MFDELLHGMPPWTLAAAGAVILAAGFLVWRISRAIVRIGFFVLYAMLGFGLSYGASVMVMGKPAPVPLLASGAALFALAVVSIRSRIWKALTAIAVVAATYIVGKFWLDRAREAAPKVEASLKRDLEERAASEARRAVRDALVPARAKPKP